MAARTAGRRAAGRKATLGRPPTLGWAAGLAVATRGTLMLALARARAVSGGGPAANRTTVRDRTAIPPMGESLAGKGPESGARRAKAALSVAVLSVRWVDVVRNAVGQ